MKHPIFALTIVAASVGLGCGSDTAATPDARVAAIDAAVPDASRADAAPPDAAVPGSEFNATHCDAVAGTLNIHWEAVAGFPSCTGIETTDGNPADATANGAVTMSGVSVDNSVCIQVSTYEFTLSANTLSLTGAETGTGVPMTLTRLPSQACFVGHWVANPFDYVAHISATAFGITPE